MGVTCRDDLDACAVGIAQHTHTHYKPCAHCVLFPEIAAGSGDFFCCLLFCCVGLYGYPRASGRRRRALLSAL